jgi:hypothetical protein
MHNIVRNKRKNVRHKRRCEKQQLQKEVFYGIPENVEDIGSGEVSTKKDVSI